MDNNGENMHLEEQDVRGRRFLLNLIGEDTKKILVDGERASAYRWEIAGGVFDNYAGSLFEIGRAKQSGLRRFGGYMWPVVSRVVLEDGALFNVSDGGYFIFVPDEVDLASEEKRLVGRVTEYDFCRGKEGRDCGRVEVYLEKGVVVKFGGVEFVVL